ncbi:MAG TPA: hypothetical protein VGB14_10825 [Acidimicrobiales bacterium]|jgi:hypothetical protein
MSDERIAGRSNLLPEEDAVGSEDPEGQAEAILAESDERVLERDVAHGNQVVEHRRSEDVVEPADD